MVRASLGMFLTALARTAVSNFAQTRPERCGYDRDYWHDRAMVDQIRTLPARRLRVSPLKD
jgi:hypothetical protein